MTSKSHSEWLTELGLWTKKSKGQPVTIWVKGLSEQTRVEKVACIQAVYERRLYRILTAALMDSEHLRPLIEGLPAMFRLKEKIQKATECNQQNLQISPVHVMT